MQFLSEKRALALLAPRISRGHLFFFCVSLDGQAKEELFVVCVLLVVNRFTLQLRQIPRNNWSVIGQVVERPENKETVNHKRNQTRIRRGESPGVTADAAP